MSHSLSPEYWNERYLNSDDPWDTGAITTPLKTYFDQLTNKDLRILIPGAGNAYEAEYLVNSGFTNVFVCDFAQEPLTSLSKRCPAFKPENLILADFFELTTSPQTASENASHHKLVGKFDLIVEQTFFCALDPALRSDYFKKIQELLAPGARLVGVLFNDVLNADKPPFGGNKEEYLSYLHSAFKIHTFEACYNSIKPRMGRELFINLERS